MIMDICVRDTDQDRITIRTAGWSEAYADIEKVVSSIWIIFLAQRGAERSIGKPEVESHYLMGCTQQQDS